MPTLAEEARMKERPILFNGEMVRAILDGRKTQTRRVIKPFTKGLEQNHPADGEVKWGRDLEPFQNEEMDGPSNYDQWWRWREWSEDWNAIGQCPYGVPGDRLWVREAWCHKWDNDGPIYNEDGDYDTTCVWYRADGVDVMKMDEDCSQAFNKDGTPSSPWLPSIHMPRWASRILLEITDVRVQRLQDIEREEVYAEGVHGPGLVPAEVFMLLTQQPTIESAEAKFLVDSFVDLWDSINAKRGFGWDVNPWVWVVEFRRVDE